MRRAGMVIPCMVIMALPSAALARPIPELPLEHWREELSLTQEQIDRIEEIGYGSRVEEIGRRGELERAELELERELRKAQPDEATALRLFDAVHKARGELDRVHFRTRLRIRSVLTTEQAITLRGLTSKKPKPPRRPERGRR